jgi:hypothetical protein
MIRTRRRVAVDEHAAIGRRHILEARVRRVGAEEQRVAGIREDSYGIILIELRWPAWHIVRIIVIVVSEIDSPPPPAARNEHQRAAIGGHRVEHDQRLDETASAVDVTPGPVALVAVLDILMPAKNDTVVGSLEVSLRQQLVHLVAAEQLRGRHSQPLVRADLEEVRLRAAGPDDPLDDLLSALPAENKMGTVKITRGRQVRRHRLQGLEALPHPRDLPGVEQPLADDKSRLVKLADLVVTQQPWHPYEDRRYPQIPAPCRAGKLSQFALGEDAS